MSNSERKALLGRRRGGGGVGRKGETERLNAVIAERNEALAKAEFETMEARKLAMHTADLLNRERDKNGVN